MVGTVEPQRRHLASESGFTLVEFLIAALIMTIVLGGTVMLATQIQQGYQTQLDDAAVEQEARYALDWITRDLRSADSDPYNVVASDQGIFLDPDGGAADDDSIRIQADVNPTDGDIADEGENVTIALDAANNVITRQDANAADSSARPMTDEIFTDLSFTFLDASRTETNNSELVSYIQIQVTARSRGRNAYTGEFTTSTLGTEVRVRTR
jgi:type II secretory pathway component PulJ